jgi:addiction module HigA family antidote
MARKIPPVHPGEILNEDFLQPLGLSMNRLALDLRVPVTRIAEIIAGKRAITPDTALRLARYFDTTPQFWMNLQVSYDLDVAEDRILRRISSDVRRLDPRRKAALQTAKAKLRKDAA